MRPDVRKASSAPVPPDPGTGVTDVAKAGELGGVRGIPWRQIGGLRKDRTSSGHGIDHRTGLSRAPPPETWPTLQAYFVTLPYPTPGAGRETAQPALPTLVGIPCGPLEERRPML